MAIETSAIALWVAKQVGGELFKTLGTRLLPKSGTSKFITARDEALRDWVFDLARLMNDLRESYADDVRQLVDARLEEHETQGVLANYCEDAYSEPLARRRRMLVHAAAALADPQLSVPEHSRVRRILRELDPDDLITLYRLWLISHTVPPGQTQPYGKDERCTLWEASGADALLASGCVRVVVKTGLSSQRDELHITRTGLLVLRAVRSFIHAESPDWSMLRRHEVGPDFRSREDADKALGSVPGLTEAILDAPRFAGWYTPAPVGRPNGKACIRFPCRPDRAAELMAKTVPITAEFGDAVETIWVKASNDLDDHGRVQLSVFGPHDLLRHAAYDIDCMWS